jgi:nucleoside-diphosphate-sugar epimerase
MVGSGKNVKSMAYIENVVGFIEYVLGYPEGVHLFNYIDKPDMDMNTVVSRVRSLLGRGSGVGIRVPFLLAWAGGIFLDIVARVSGKDFALSAIRVRKFCATTQFSSNAASSGYRPPYTLEEGLERTVRYEFLEDNTRQAVFFTE